MSSRPNRRIVRRVSDIDLPDAVRDERRFVDGYANVGAASKGRERSDPTGPRIPRSERENSQPRANPATAVVQRRSPRTAHTS